MATKQLLGLFGFPYHNAPGEAEAECALLQRRGIVDAVLSEDVDTLMFGSGLTLRDWSSEGARGSKAPTHVSLFEAKKTTGGISGLDREGMILVALLRGGDYNTVGLRGIGIKVACQAARAGFGKSLCNLRISDEDGLAAWRKELTHELQTNESKFFGSKHKSLSIPDTFPSKEILGYYTHPVVSSDSKIEKLKKEIKWDGIVDVPRLREYVKDAFDWKDRGGARKFIRNLAPALLVHQLRLRVDRRDSGYGDLILTQMQEMEYVRSICGQREHFNADGMPELRVVFHPMDIVGLDLEAEHDDSTDYGRDGLAPVNEHDQIEAYVSDEDASAVPGKRAASTYDPTQLDKTWIPEILLKLSLPLKVEDYKAAELAKRLPKEPKAKASKATGKNKKAATTIGGMQRGALDKYVRTSRDANELEDSMVPRLPSKAAADSLPGLPPVYLAPSLERTASQPHSSRAVEVRPTSRTAHSSTDALSTKALPKTRARSKATAPIKPKANANPWSLAVQATTSNQTKPSVTKPLQASRSKPSDPPASFQRPINLDSSPFSSPEPSHHDPRKHIHSASPPDSRPPLSDHELSLPNTVTISRGNKSRHRHGATSTPSKSQARSPSRPSPRTKSSPGRSSKPRSRTHTRDDEPAPVTRRLSFSTPERNSRKTEHAGSGSGIGWEQDTDDDSDEFPGLEVLLSSPRRAHASSSLTLPSATQADAGSSIRTGANSSFSLSPTTTAPSSRLVIDLDSSPPQPRSSHPTKPHPVKPAIAAAAAAPPVAKAHQTKKPKTYIVPRESLAGAWVALDEEEFAADRERRARRERKSREGVLRVSAVEVLDLTGE